MLYLTKLYLFLVIQKALKDVAVFCIYQLLFNVTSNLLGV